MRLQIRGIHVEILEEKWYDVQLSNKLIKYTYIYIDVCTLIQICHLSHVYVWIWGQKYGAYTSYSTFQ